MSFLVGNYSNIHHRRIQGLGAPPPFLAKLKTGKNVFQFRPRRFLFTMFCNFRFDFFS